MADAEPLTTEGMLRRRLKRSLGWGTVMSGAAALARRGQTGRLRILMYHGVVPRRHGPAAFGDLFISQDDFARQMRHLQRAFRVLALDEALDVMAARGRFPDRAVLLTFDDGYRNTLTTALPVLQALRLPVTVFVVPGLIDRGEYLWFDGLRVLMAQCASRGRRVHLGEDLTLNGGAMTDAERTFSESTQRIVRLPRAASDRIAEQVLGMVRDDRLMEGYPEFALAGWEEWRQATTGGLVTIGSHGLLHGNLLSIDPQACLEDLRQSKRRIEELLARECRALAYPYGARDHVLADAAREAGYACAMTTDDGLNDAGDDPWTLSRTMVGDQGHFALFCARVSGAWDPIRAWRPGGNHVARG